MPFLRVIRSKVNIVVELKFILVYYGVAVLDVCHYATGTTLKQVS